VECRKTQNGKQAGDPAKLAHALVVIANESQPPRRFLAGANATGLAEQKIAKLREDIESHATSRLHLLSPRTTTACLSGRDDRHVPPTTNSDQTTYRSPCPSSPSASGHGSGEKTRNRDGPKVGPRHAGAMAQRSVFERGAHVRRRIARALVLLAGAGLVTWIGLVATAVVPNGGTVELPDFVGPLQQAVAPARGGAPAGAAIASPAATSSRPAIVIPPLPFFATPTPTPTNLGGGPHATFPGHTPDRTPKTSPPGR